MICNYHVTHGKTLLQTHANQGYDPLLEDKTGRSLTFPPGYERTKRGPTTNFVGNHMTQVPKCDAFCLERAPPAPRTLYRSRAILDMSAL